MNMLANAADWLTEQRHEHLTDAVTYWRGGASVEVSATVGSSEHDVHDGFGGSIRVETRDYLIRTEDLILDDERTLPVSGDQVVEVIDGTEVTYEVAAPGQNEPCFRYSDSRRKTLRIHTKNIDEVEL